MKKVIATDLDGTLFYPRKKFTMIPKKNVAFLRRFIQAGGRVVIVSGRNMPYAYKVMDKIGYPLDVIGCNSAFINVNKEFISEKFLPNPRAQEVLAELSSHFGCSHYILLSKDESLVISGKELNWFGKIMYKIIYGMQGIYAEKYVTSKEVFDREIAKGQVYKMMLYFGLGKKAHNRACEANKYIREHYQDLDSSWTGQFIDITASNVNKAQGLIEYCDKMNIDHKDLYVIGDSGNDISMFNAFENSFCMGHAPAKIQKYAKYIVKDFADLENYLTPKEEKK